MIGTHAVGKTSLVRQFVDSIFSEKYLTTVGVKIDKKQINVNQQDVMLMLWDLAGEDEFTELNPTYLKGSSGLILVADGTRANTLNTVIKFQKELEQLLPNAPFVLVLNKQDLKPDWTIDLDQVQQLKDSGWHVIETSAKTGNGVEDTFHTLTQKMLG